MRPVIQHLLLLASLILLPALGTSACGDSSADTVRLPCTKTSDCPDDMMCHRRYWGAGACVPSCSGRAGQDNPECPKGDWCVLWAGEGFCRTMCSGTSGCNPWEVCDGYSESCIPKCRDDGDCLDDESCDQSGRCIQCEDDSDCPGSTTCILGAYRCTCPKSCTCDCSCGQVTVEKGGKCVDCPADCPDACAAMCE